MGREGLPLEEPTDSPCDPDSCWDVPASGGAQPRDHPADRAARGHSAHRLGSPFTGGGLLCLSFPIVNSEVNEV